MYPWVVVDESGCVLFELLIGFPITGVWYIREVDADLLIGGNGDFLSNVCCNGPMAGSDIV